jgi:hypothetical protein
MRRCGLYKKSLPQIWKGRNNEIQYSVGVPGNFNAYNVIKSTVTIPL